MWGSRDDEALGTDGCGRRKARHPLWPGDDDDDVVDDDDGDDDVDNDDDDNEDDDATCTD